MNALSGLRRVSSLLGILCLLGHAGIATAQEQTIRVSTVTQLVAAINAANQTQQQTHITVAPGQYQFTQSFGSNYGPAVLPTIRSTILIIGEDAATTTFDASAAEARIFTVLQTGNLLVRNITLTGGIACVPDNCDFAGGGAALNLRGTLTFAECVITGNHTFPSTGEGTMAALGGGIETVEGILTLEQTKLTGNGVPGYGGGLAQIGGSTLIHESVISNNGAALIAEHGSFTAFGGGIYLASGELSVEFSTISGNSVGPDPTRGFFDVGIGAGIFNGGTVTITNSAVTGNTVTNIGSGGGIYNSGTMTIENTTLTGNIAATSGGGLDNAGILSMQGVTIVNNQALGNGLQSNPFMSPSFPPGCTFGQPQSCPTGGSGIWSEAGAGTQMANSVLADNNGSDCGGVVITNGHNALSTSAGCTLRTSPALQGHTVADQINVDPRLGTLQDNGAPGNAHYPLLAGSPLIDAGGSIGKFCTQTDQLGQKRVEGDGKSNKGASICDIGAIEFAP